MTWLVVERTAIAVHLFPIEVAGASRFFVFSEPTAACGFVLRQAKKDGHFVVRAADTSDGWDICAGCLRTRLGREFPPPVEPFYGHEVGPATSEDRRRRRRRGAESGWFRATIELAFVAPTLDDAQAWFSSLVASALWFSDEHGAIGSWRLDPAPPPARL